MKSYHRFCQRKSLELKCFNDEIHLCICQQVDEESVANCLEFDHQMDLNCSSQSGCLNGGQCSQEYSDCPRVSICACSPCSYCKQCQLSTDIFSLSLDAILAFHIRPYQSISHQPWSVLMSLILTLLVVFLGLTNGIFSLITFDNASTRESGCGIYLFSSSILTIFTMIIFLLKFFIVLFSQMGSIRNGLFLTVQCHSIDYFLRSTLTMDQWLSAFVAIERAFIMHKGANFDREKSKSVAKGIVSGLVLITMVTNVLDPIYRSLFEEDEVEDEERRVWCIVQYPSYIRILDLITNVIHFFLPFFINLISAITVIILGARQQAKFQTHQKYKELLQKQIHQHKNLLIGPCILVVLAIPRLIISLKSGCMKSSSDSFLFLFGYFISLIPPLLTFILFVLPSDTYKQAFRKAIGEYRNVIGGHSDNQV